LGGRGEKKKKTGPRAAGFIGAEGHSRLIQLYGGWGGKPAVGAFGDGFPRAKRPRVGI